MVTAGFLSSFGAEIRLDYIEVPMLLFQTTMFSPFLNAGWML